MDDNQVKPGVTNSIFDNWVDEFQQQHLAPPETWAAEFTAREVFIFLVYLVKFTLFQFLLLMLMIVVGAKQVFGI